MEPDAAVSKYGAQLMESIRNLSFDPSAVTSLSSPALNPLGKPAQDSQPQLQPVTFNVGGSIIATQAEPDAVKQFRSAMQMQALKTGRKL
jgi:hypothetical protein